MLFIHDKAHQSSIFSLSLFHQICIIILVFYHAKARIGSYKTGRKSFSQKKKYFEMSPSVSGLPFEVLLLLSNLGILND